MGLLTGYRAGDVTTQQVDNDEQHPRGPHRIRISDSVGQSPRWGRNARERVCGSAIPRVRQARAFRPPDTLYPDICNVFRRISNVMGFVLNYSAKETSSPEFYFAYDRGYRYNYQHPHAAHISARLRMANRRSQLRLPMQRILAAAASPPMTSIYGISRTYTTSLLDFSMLLQNCKFAICTKV